MENKDILEDEKKKEEYSRLFSNFFEMNITKKDFSQLPMLSFVLEKFSNDFDEPTKEIKDLRNKVYDVYEKLLKDFTNEQKNQMEKYQELTSEIEHKDKEKIFCYGYLIGYKLAKELNI